ncbi:hypothetical protein C8R44DRAFT_753980 [Mycena epipterygia]|nr:hypothetical protein C8R44DRAFT_753977 [Mycena epipterygia]KAJ7081675.1 hypothetical protein C8R44DRAFT_753980 [Mycena epipterygia]
MYREVSRRLRQDTGILRGANCLNIKKLLNIAEGMTRKFPKRIIGLIGDGNMAYGFDVISHCLQPLPIHGVIEKKGHGEPSGDNGHNSVADMVAKEYDGPDSFLVGLNWINPRGGRGKSIGANDGWDSVGEGSGRSYNPV